MELSRFTRVTLFIASLCFCLFGYSQVEDYQNYRKKIDKLSGTKRLDYYSTLIDKLIVTSPVLAEKILKEGISDAEIQKDTSFLISFHRTMGGLRHHLGEPEKATQNFKKSLDYAKDFGDPIELAKSKVNMTKVYLYNKQYDRGIKNLREAIETFEQSDEKEVLGIAYSNLANMFREKGDLEQAIEYGKRTIPIQQEIKDDKNLAITYMNLGSVYSLQKNFKDASECFDKALTILSGLKAKIELTFLYLEYSKMYQLQESYPQAALYANLALEIAKNSNSLDYQGKALNQLALIDYEQRKFETSIEYLIEQMILQDSLNTELQSKKVRETSALFSVYESEKKANTLKYQVEREKNSFRIVLIISICIFLLLVAMVFLWSRIRAKNKVLFEQSKKMRVNHSFKSKDKMSKEDEGKYQELYVEILHKFEQEKVYLDSSLTMGMLSDIVRSNSNYVSKSINLFFGANFNSMINYYRVNEAKDLIESGALETYTMETIASKSGFTSLSVFNRSFKKETGITPTYFYKSLK